MELGAGITHDMRGEALAAGDRITWSEYFIPGPNYFTEVLDLPQKSPGVDKYGHMAATTEPHHHGGFGEYCYVLPQSWILKLPADLTDEEATPDQLRRGDHDVRHRAGRDRHGRRGRRAGPGAPGPLRRGDRQGRAARGS